MRFNTSLKKKYRNAFFEYQTSVIKRRIGFFCILSVFLYILFTGISLLIIPRPLTLAEMSLIKIIIISSLFIYLSVRVTKSDMLIKLYAYIYTALLLYVITELNFMYPELIKVSAATYVFTLFFICFSIPWDPIDTVNITGFHLIAYTVLYLYSPKYMTDEVRGIFDVFYYMGAITFLCIGFLLFSIVRRKDKKIAFENFILFKEEEARKEQIDKELLLAAKVNETLVPKSVSTNYVDIDVKYIPASYMSGDYSRYHFAGQDMMLFVICDVTGHGVSSALLVNRMHTEFTRLIKEENDPEIILKGLNSFIINEFIGMYVSAFCGLADLKNGKLLYANYGHPGQYLYRKEGTTVEEIPPRTTLLGVIDDPDIDPQKDISLQAGDRIFLFTDGLLEAKGKKQQEYGKKRLEEFIKNNIDLTPSVFNEKLFEDIKRFNVGDFQDDIFLINILIKKTGEI